MPRTSHFAVLIAVAAGGCAVLAKKPPTPAARLDGEALARMRPPPGERYYLLVFAFQPPVLKQPKYCHTWATAVRVTTRPGDPDPGLETHTISWLPATADIHPERPRVEPGRNFGLDETIALALHEKCRVSVWGPYEVWHGFYHRFTVQKEFLDSGRVGYQCVDNVGEAARTGDGCDCIHAVTDLDPVYGRGRYPLSYFGDAASEHVVRRIMHSPVVIDPPRTHDWLLPRLGLDRYPIARREYRGKAVPYQPGSTGLDEVGSARPAKE